MVIEYAIRKRRIQIGLTLGGTFRHYRADAANLSPLCASPPLNRKRTAHNGEKVPFLVVKKLREAILDETFKPGDHLLEEELSERFEVSRSPVREALLALEKEGTVIIAPYKGAILKSLSPDEAWDIAEIRLALISLAAKPAHRHLSPADFDFAQEIARRVARTRSAIDYAEDTMRFWDLIFQKSQRPILPEVFTQLHRRTTRYYPLFINLFPDRTSKRTHREVFIDLYREGKITEALRVFKKMYLKVIDRVIDHLKVREASKSSPRAHRAS